MFGWKEAFFLASSITIAAAIFFISAFLFAHFVGLF